MPGDPCRPSDVTCDNVAITGVRCGFGDELACCLVKQGGQDGERHAGEQRRRVAAPPGGQPAAGAIGKLRRVPSHPDNSPRTSSSGSCSRLIRATARPRRKQLFLHRARPATRKGIALPVNKDRMRRSNRPGRSGQGRLRRVSRAPAPGLGRCYDLVGAWSVADTANMLVMARSESCSGRVAQIARTVG